MTPSSERIFLQLAASFITENDGEETNGVKLTDDISEEMDVEETLTVTHINDNSIKLTDGPHRLSDKVALSCALVTAVKLNAIEKKLDNTLLRERKSVESIVRGLSSWNLETVSAYIFTSTCTLHDLRHSLSVGTEAPDMFWDFELQGRLFTSLLDHFDVNERIEALNSRLSWTFDFLHTVADYVDKKHSSRLEKIIIVLIALELGLGIVSLSREIRHRVSLPCTDGVVTNGL